MTVDNLKLMKRDNMSHFSGTYTKRVRNRHTEIVYSKICLNKQIIHRPTHHLWA